MAAALLRDDEAGWMAGVDPGDPQVQVFPQHPFRSLRALDVTQFSFEDRTPPFYQGATELSDTIHSVYCFSVEICPKYLSVDTKGRRTSRRSSPFA